MPTLPPDDRVRGPRCCGFRKTPRPDGLTAGVYAAAPRGAREQGTRYDAAAPAARSARAR